MAGGVIDIIFQSREGLFSLLVNEDSELNAPADSAPVAIFFSAWRLDCELGIVAIVEQVNYKEKTPAIKNTGVN
jgi:hypothetical protein